MEPFVWIVWLFTGLLAVIVGALALIMVAVIQLVDRVDGWDAIMARLFEDDDDD